MYRDIKKDRKILPRVSVYEETLGKPWKGVRPSIKRVTNTEII